MKCLETYEKFVQLVNFSLRVDPSGWHAANIEVEVCAPHHTDGVLRNELLEHRVVVSGPVEVEPSLVILSSRVLKRVAFVVAQYLALSIGRVRVEILDGLIVLRLRDHVAEC